MWNLDVWAENGAIVRDCANLTTYNIEPLWDQKVDHVIVNSHYSRTNFTIVKDLKSTCKWSETSSYVVAKL